MTKRMTLPGLLLMAVALPLYANLSSPVYDVSVYNPVALGRQISARPLGQIVDSLAEAVQPFSILDTRRPMTAEVADTATVSFVSTSILAPVPEPTNYVLIGLGLFGLYLARRERLRTR